MYQRPQLVSLLKTHRLSFLFLLFLPPLSKIRGISKTLAYLVQKLPNFGHDLLITFGTPGKQSR
jgi:hypothetical protein